MATITVTDTPACAWCRDPIERTGKHGPKPLYCSNLHRYWAICQTCGYQTDRPDLKPGRLTPRNMFSNNSDIKERLVS